MNMTWIDLALAVAVAALIVMIPGLLVVSSLGLRGMRLWGFAAPAGVTVVSVAATIAPFLGLSWSILPVLLVAVFVVAVCIGLRVLVSRLTRRPVLAPRPDGPRHLLPVVSALVIGGGLIGLQVVAMLGAPDNISQTFDNVFHLNAIRYAVDNGNASPLFIASMTSGDGPAGFYPSGWHAFGSLVMATTSVSVPVASNAVMLVFTAVVWPASALLLVRELGVTSRIGLIAAGAAVAAFPAFPLLVLEYGVLYPFMMGVTLLPAVLAAVVRFATPDGQGGRIGWMILVIGFLPGLAIAHPGALVAALAFSIGPLALSGARGMRTASSRGRLLIGTAAVAYVGAFVAAWYALRPEDIARSWTPQETVAQAVGEVVAVAPWFAPVNVAMALLVAVGVVTAVMRRRRSDLVMLSTFVIAAALYIVASGLPYWEIRDLLVGPWYNNAPRLAALLPIAWVPLAALGADRSWRALRAWQGRRRTRVLSSVSIAVASAVIVLVVVPQGFAVRQAVDSAAALYRYTDESPLLTSDELALIERLPDSVPADAVVIGSPWTGVALTYALVDRDVLMPHTLTTTTEDENLINDGLRTAVAGSDVCQAVDDLNAEFVLDFGVQEVNYGTHVFPGLRNLSSSRAVELIDSEGQARLYRVVACDR